MTLVCVSGPSSICFSPSDSLSFLGSIILLIDGWMMESEKSELYYYYYYYVLPGPGPGPGPGLIIRVLYLPSISYRISSFVSSG